MRIIKGLVITVLYVFLHVYSLGGKAVLERHPSRGRVKRKAADAEDTLVWRNATIYFTVSDELLTYGRAMGAIAESMKHWEDMTCIRFNFVRPNETQSLAHIKYAQFIAGDGCSSSVGRGPGVGPQNISIGAGCSYREMIVHELGHLVGMWHEHARIDRDNNVVVLWNNIRPGMDYNFVRMPEMRLLAPYDLLSLMHYNSDTFSKNNQPTLKALDERLTFLMGYRRELSFYDILTVNKMYNCSAGCDSGAPRCENEGFLQHTCTCLCPRGLIGATCNRVISSPACGGVLEVSETEDFQLTSPNYPNPYPRNLRCTWLLKSPPNTVMRMRLDEMDVERSDGRLCRDRLEIRYTHIGISRGPVFCGPEAGDEVQSATNLLMVHFVTNAGRAVNKGFNASITVLPKTDCASNPCQNGGICRDYPDLNDYVCFCVDHWIGHDCDVPVVNGGFSSWSEWGSCPASCGVRSRSRTCTNPAPDNGGNQCEGASYETERCANQDLCRHSYYCDFGSTAHPYVCGMRADTESLADWELHSGPTPSQGTGPHSGHTSGDITDMYYYLEASVGYKYDDATFWLPSRTWSVGSYCLQFFYSMRGDSVATLAVLRGYPGLEDSSTLWQRSGPQGDSWMEAHITVLLYRNVEVGFFAVRGDAYDADIAVDDISISEGACQEPVNNTPYGCANPENENDRIAVGDFSYFDACLEISCFCNQDGHLDCPEWMSENVCSSQDSGEGLLIRPGSSSNDVQGNNNNNNNNNNRRRNVGDSEEVPGTLGDDNNLTGSRPSQRLRLSSSRKEQGTRRHGVNLQAKPDRSQRVLARPQSSRVATKQSSTVTKLLRRPGSPSRQPVDANGLLRRPSKTLGLDLSGRKLPSESERNRKREQLLVHHGSS